MKILNLLKKIFNPKNSKNPEEDYIITITDVFIRVEHHEKTDEINWEDIKEIKFINTDSGPFTIDIWLALIGDNNSCMIPHGTDNCEKIYNIVSKYEGFDFENVIKSMSTTTNEQFSLWKRK